MKINRIVINNYRLLKDFSLDLERDLSLIIGKNNTGKTSILSVIEKFLNSTDLSRFSNDDFNLNFKESLKESLDGEALISDGIKLYIYIDYEETDDLSNISKVMMDLDPDNNMIVLGFEYILSESAHFKFKSDYKGFLENENTKKHTDNQYKPKDFNYFFKHNYSTYFKHFRKSIKYNHISKEIDLKNTLDLDKEKINIRDIINFKYVSAKRDVANKDSNKTLSKQTSSIYRKSEDDAVKIAEVEKFKDQLAATDDKLSNIYKELFSNIITKISDLGGMKCNESIIDIVSTLQHKELLEGNTTGQVKEGSIKFIYSTNEDLITVRNFLKDNYGWNFEDTLETKELNLTHNLIANKAGFKTLMDIYDSDPIIKLKNDILRKIKDNKNKGVPDIIFDENDSFDSVVDKFMLKDRSKQLKKEVILSCPNNKHLYDSLKDKPFSEVRRIYLDKDSLIDDKKESEDEESKKGSKRDNLIKHLFKIQNIIQLYNDGMYNEFLRKTNYIINSIQDKRDLKQKIEELSNVQDKTIGEIIYDANTNNICLMDDNLEKFKREYEYIYNRVKDVKYEEFQHLYKYLEGSTPFSTQHKTKGREYNNVLVILDNGDWNDYNFNYLFNSENVLAELNAGKSKTKSKLASFPKILARTQKIFYVCCTRSKENLALFFHNPSQPIIDKAIDWFGSMNIINLD